LLDGTYTSKLFSCCRFELVLNVSYTMGGVGH
jgi:hypothetical protein